MKTSYSRVLQDGLNNTFINSCLFSFIFIKYNILLYFSYYIEMRWLHFDGESSLEGLHSINIQKDNLMRWWCLHPYISKGHPCFEINIIYNLAGRRRHANTNSNLCVCVIYCKRCSNLSVQHKETVKRAETEKCKNN